MTGNVVQLSQHKYASNVVEKCLEYGDSTERDYLIEEILAESEGNDCLLVRQSEFLFTILAFSFTAVIQ